MTLMTGMPSGTRVLSSAHRPAASVSRASKFLKRRPKMEAMITLLVLFLALAALGCASLIWGVDSRGHYTDDHIRLR
jgi:hypothetical protein